VIAIRTYPTRLEAELARLTLEGADIPAAVAGIDMSMEGGTAGVRLLVPEAFAQAALALLDTT
jgi:hypothetical protein